MTKEEKLMLITEAREFGCKAITIEGIVYELGVIPIVKESMTDEEIQGAVKNMSVLDEYSPDEILYWSSPHFEELQAQKELRQQQLKESANG